MSRKSNLSHKTEMSKIFSHSIQEVRYKSVYGRLKTLGLNYTSCRFYFYLAKYTKKDNLDNIFKLKNYCIPNPFKKKNSISSYIAKQFTGL